MILKELGHSGGTEADRGRGRLDRSGEDHLDGILSRGEETGQ